VKPHLNAAARICLPRTPAIAIAGTADFRANDHSAKGDGIATDTAAIRKATDAAAKAGEGTVVLKPGTYLSGSLFLKTGVNLRLDEGVEIQGAQDQAAYPVMPGSITNADNWTFTDTHTKATVGSVVALKDSEKVIGLPAK
jgi:polygalacturonase